MNRLTTSKFIVMMSMIVAIFSCSIIDQNTQENNNVQAKPDQSENDDEAEAEDSVFVTQARIMKGAIEVSVNFSANARASASLFVALPLPESNQYQCVSLKNTNGVIGCTEGGGSFAYWNNSYSNGGSVNQNCHYAIEYETYSMSFNFQKIKDLHPYDTESDIYKKYTGSSGEYIVPDNSDIVSIASTLWESSEDVVSYARKCYEYTAAKYQYLNPNTGLHKLEDNLRNGGGDCGNLSAIYISLLRSKNIPSRPIVCIRPDGSFHVWSEFYLELYGWIPVDVTYKNSDRNGDYFGYYPGDCIVVSNEFQVLLRIDDKEFKTPLLQNYAYWYRNMSNMRERYNVKKLDS